MEASNNDNEDRCLGAGVTSTRTIQPGEQIFVSLSGDSNIAEAWEEIFRCKCYCCACSSTCSDSKHMTISPQDGISPETGKVVEHQDHGKNMIGEQQRATKINTDMDIEDAVMKTSPIGFPRNTSASTQSEPVRTTE